MGRNESIGRGGPESNWYDFDSHLGVRRGDVINATVSAIIGAILGWAVSALFTAPKKLELWAVIVVSIAALMTCATVLSFLTAFQMDGRARVALLANSFDKVRKAVIDSIEGSAVLVPRGSIYPEMARCIREATNQVVIITYFMYDWESNRRTFEPTVTGTVAGIDEFYEAIYQSILDPNVEYLRVWQVPAERVGEARAKIAEDERLAKEIELIESISPDHPDQCRVKIIPEATTASVILVDRRTLFFNIDFYDADRGLWMSPFMLMIRDARGRAFNDLKRVVVKLSM
jgi:hypothetical protein